MLLYMYMWQRVITRSWLVIKRSLSALVHTTAITAAYSRRPRPLLAEMHLRLDKMFLLSERKGHAYASCEAKYYPCPQKPAAMEDGVATRARRQSEVRNAVREDDFTCH